MYMNNVEKILGMYIKGYISKEKFEVWVYDNADLLERTLPDIYLELIGTSYGSKSEDVELAGKIKKYLGKKSNILWSDINDCTVQKYADESREIRDLIKQQKIRECIDVDCGSIQSSYDLHKILRDVFELGDYYGMNWDAFEDFIYGDANIPKKIVFHKWNCLEEKMPEEARIFLNLLRKYVSSKCEIIFNEYE